MVRINKFLAQCKFGSRRKVETLIIEKKVKINGVLCTDLAAKIDPEKDEVIVSGKIVKHETEKIYLMMNKPKNYLVSHEDQFDRKLVYSLLPNFNCHLFAIGRLDFMSEGLLLFTNDGDFANRIIHPRYKLPKIYKVTCAGKLTPEQLTKLKKMDKLEGSPINRPVVNVKVTEEKKTIIRMIIFEGKKRQIRKMIKNIGSEVKALKRLQIGDVKLDKLPIGMWRFLTPREIESLWRYDKNIKVSRETYKENK